MKVSEESEMRGSHLQIVQREHTGVEFNLSLPKVSFLKCSLCVNFNPHSLDLNGQFLTQIILCIIDK